MCANGYIKISRSLLNWEWYGDAHMVQLWIYLLLNANYTDVKWRGRVIPRGSLVITRASVCEHLKMSERTFRTCLGRLIETGEITKQTTNKNTLVTITNFDTYQCSESDQRPTNDQQATNKRPTNDQQNAKKRPTENSVYSGSSQSFESDQRPTSDQQATNDFTEKSQKTTSIYKEERNNIFFVYSACAREEFFEKFFAEQNRGVNERLCMRLGVDESNLKRLVTEVLDEWELTGQKMHRDLQDAKQHLVSQMRIVVDKERRQKQIDQSYATKETERKRRSGWDAPSYGTVTYSDKWE